MKRTTFPRRKNRRWRDHDYSEPGFYFITLRVDENAGPLLAEPVAGAMRHTLAGEIVRQEIARIDRPDLGVRVDRYTVMPDHVHLIVQITRSLVIEVNAAPIGAAGSRPGSLGAIIGSLKSRAARRIRVICGTPGTPVFQDGYFDRVIRDGDELARRREYVDANAREWIAKGKQPRIRMYVAPEPWSDRGPA